MLLFQGCELFYPEKPLGSIHAIYVGLNYYGTGVNHLEGTLNDAREIDLCLFALSTRLHRKYCSYPMLQTGEEYQNPSIYDLSTLPRKDTVLETIESLRATLTEDDLTIFSYSGHGIEGGSLVLAPPFLDKKITLDENNRPKEDVLLNVAELLSALSALPGKKLLILDSCYCGSFVEESGSSVSLVEKETFLDAAFSTYFSSARYSPSLFVLAATTRDNTSKEPSGTVHKHGHFTKALLDGLGWDHEENALGTNIPALKKGALTTDSLYSYILENQNFPLEGLHPRQYQHPTISGGAYALRLF